jgi:DMSO/TMAO reductase YedYZ heme-binding membrane subunit
LNIPDRGVRFVLKPIVFVASLGPVAWLVWAAVTGNLSANPLSDLTNETGVWTLRFLCITLAITPLRRLSGWNGAIRFRRMVGLFAFFYGSLHFLTYVIADRFAGLDFPDGILAWTTVISRNRWRRTSTSGRSLPSASRRSCRCCRWRPRPQPA